MTIATEIYNEASKSQFVASTAHYIADEKCEEVDNDFEKEETTYTFIDDSVLVICNEDVKVGS